MFRIYPYKMGSKSVRKLKENLDALVIKLEGSRYVPKSEHVIINWGNSQRPAWMTEVVHEQVLNTPESVAIASNKLTTFEALERAGVPHVPFTTDKSSAEEWLESSKVFVRQKLQGHSGDGIEVVDQAEDLSKVTETVNLLDELGYQDAVFELEHVINSMLPALPYAPLYTKGVSNGGEYRVHVFKGDVILYQKKSRRLDEEGNVLTAEGEHADVRNLSSNWVYRTGNLRRLERIEQLACDAVSALGLDFGAVDIIKQSNGDVLVLEVNSAPGLGNTDTVDAYTDAFNTL